MQRAQVLSTIGGVLLAVVGLVTMGQQTFTPTGLLVAIFGVLLILHGALARSRAVSEVLEQGLAILSEPGTWEVLRGIRLKTLQKLDPDITRHWAIRQEVGSQEVISYWEVAIGPDDEYDARGATPEELRIWTAFAELKEAIRA